MAVYVMADTHLSFARPKPMDVFGSRWADHAEKIRKNFTEKIEEQDTVVIPGDISWGINLEEALPDLQFLDALPGHKIFLKGNHDYWWDTVTKMNRFLEEHRVGPFQFLHNNAIRCENFIFCGSRGWYTEDKKVVSANEIDTKKIFAREVGRLKTSLDCGRAMQKRAQETEGVTPELLAFLHFPPYFKDYICNEIIDELEKAGVRRCYFGHIHGVYDVPAVRSYRGIRFHMIAGDYLNFVPVRIDPE